MVESKSIQTKVQSSFTSISKKQSDLSFAELVDCEQVIKLQHPKPRLVDRFRTIILLG